MGDQTKPEWLAHADQGLGTGVSAEPARSQFTYRFQLTYGFQLTFEYRYHRNVSYSGFLELVEGNPRVVAFQWVPHAVATEEDVVDADCGEDLPCHEEGKLCVQFGCLCIKGICGRKKLQ